MYKVLYSSKPSDTDSRLCRALLQYCNTPSWLSPVQPSCSRHSAGTPHQNICRRQMSKQSTPCIKQRHSVIFMHAYSQTLRLDPQLNCKTITLKFRIFMATLLLLDLTEGTMTQSGRVHVRIRCFLKHQFLVSFVPPITTTWTSHTPPLRDYLLNYHVSNIIHSNNTEHLCV